MALKAGSVLALPDLACIGSIAKVGDAYLSQKGEYHVFSIEVKAKFAGRDGVFFVVFEPEWFAPGFSPADLLEREKGSVKYGMYGRTVLHEEKPTILTAILGESFEAFDADLDKSGIGEARTDLEAAKIVSSLVRKHAIGREVVYIMTQRKDEEGKLMETYNVQRFLPYSEDTLVDLAEQAANGKRKTPLVVTWDE